MTIKDKIQRRKRRKAAEEAIRNIYEYVEKVVDEISISLGDALAEVKIKGNAPAVDDDEDEHDDD